MNDNDSSDKLGGVGEPAREVFRSIDKLAETFPALSQALDNALAELSRHPKTVTEKRAVDARLAGIASAFQKVQEALVHLLEVSKDAAEEQRTSLWENEILRRRVAELEADIVAWQREYEPDTDPKRPAFFSNIRQAFAVFRDKR